MDNSISDYVLRSMRRKLRPFGKEVDHKLLFVYWKQFAEVRSECAACGVKRRSS